METLSCREVKGSMAEILSRVAYNRKRYKIVRHSKEMVPQSTGLDKICRKQQPLFLLPMLQGF
jgi:hypothetical protein